MAKSFRPYPYDTPTNSISNRVRSSTRQSHSHLLTYFSHIAELCRRYGLENLQPFGITSENMVLAGQLWDTFFLSHDYKQLHFQAEIKLDLSTADQNNILLDDLPTTPQEIICGLNNLYGLPSTPSPVRLTVESGIPVDISKDVFNDFYDNGEAILLLFDDSIEPDVVDDEQVALLPLNADNHECDTTETSTKATANVDKKSPENIQMLRFV